MNSPECCRSQRGLWTQDGSNCEMYADVCWRMFASMFRHFRLVFKTSFSFQQEQGASGKTTSVCPNRMSVTSWVPSFGSFGTSNLRAASDCTDVVCCWLEQIEILKRRKKIVDAEHGEQKLLSLPKVEANAALLMFSWVGSSGWSSVAAQL